MRILIMSALNAVLQIALYVIPLAALFVKKTTICIMVFVFHNALLNFMLMVYLASLVDLIAKHALARLTINAYRVIH